MSERVPSIEPFRNKLIIGNAIDVLKILPDNSIHCCVTSPPYWGLRAYKTEPQIWPDTKPLCEEHEWIENIQPAANGIINTEMQGLTLSGNSATRKPKHSDFCLTCNAWRGELGLEPTPELYVQHIAEIFREVKRVLRKDGTLWLNMGDCYVGGNRTNFGGNQNFHSQPGRTFDGSPRNEYCGLPAKNLCMMPARVAMALQADGWYLRSDIIWAKPNPMPESVTDRPTKSHEYIFLLTKSVRYFYDQEAVRETSQHSPGGPFGGRLKDSNNEVRGDVGNARGGDNGIYDRRNLRSVWNIPTAPFKGAHFATFPPNIPERCIKAGTSQKGCCPKCGSPWERNIEPSQRYRKILGKGYHDHNFDLEMGMKSVRGGNYQNKMRDAGILSREMCTTGWQPTCKCREKQILPCIVLDPFLGSGTVAEVAKRLGRDYLGIDLHPTYIKDLAETRLEKIDPLFSMEAICQ